MSDSPFTGMRPHVCSEMIAFGEAPFAARVRTLELL